MNEASKIYIGPVAMFQCTRTRIGGNLKVLIKVSVVEAAKKSFVWHTFGFRKYHKYVHIVDVMICIIGTDR